MSVIIIGGGDNARGAISKLETASLEMSDSQRAAAEDLLETLTKALNSFRAACGC